MSRGGRGGGRGGFGGGRGALGGAGNPLPMGLTYQDVQSMNRDEDALYPPLESTPALTEYSANEKRICALQNGFAERLRRSPYCVVEPTKSADLEQYSDKHRILAANHPTLKRKDLHEPFFPREVFDGYFNPRKKRQTVHKSSKKINLDDLVDNADELERSDEERSEAAGSQPEEEDYDVDEEYDNDYAENYFDNGEGDDLDDLGGGGGGDDGGGDYD
ncbi:DNA-directed RNA polymerase III, subunit Rpc31 [Vararia minispora EC-137]|uniref:DNA-directed RNA polymerase III, subunit Rpc31 n=1 Tax=Vararia minispora EC-137 TaxID=1314806 RepID=A0ACB8QWB9_9AGAM|nr:DNA-directed RNA polymerase III, subunit Rpc31 [Vararia minispora EC-137]